jgi:hypothetical protein
MTEPSNGISNQAAEFLGDQPNEVALFALGHRPTSYRPLTDAEVSNLRAAVAGTLPASLSGSVRELLKQNSAATEFVMSEQLITVANQSVYIPPHLRKKILTAAKPVAGVAPRRNWSIRSWPYAPLGAATAALAIAISFYELNRGDRPNFEVAALDDHEILADSGVVTRGGPQTDAHTPSKPAPIVTKSGAVVESTSPVTLAADTPPPEVDARTPSKPLKYVEIDLPRAFLTDFFAEDQSGKSVEENRVISRLSGALNEKEKVRFIFDAATKPLLTREKDELFTVRVYDLSNPANKQLASALHLPDNGKGYFVSPAP